MKLRALEHCRSGGALVQSRQGSEPLSDFENESLLAWLFPHLDPFGIGGFHHPKRIHKLTLDDSSRTLYRLMEHPLPRTLRLHLSTTTSHRNGRLCAIATTAL